MSQNKRVHEEENTTTPKKTSKRHCRMKADYHVMNPYYRNKDKEDNENNVTTSKYTEEIIIPLSRVPKTISEHRIFLEVCSRIARSIVSKGEAARRAQANYIFEVDRFRNYCASCNMFPDLKTREDVRKVIGQMCDTSDDPENYMYKELLEEDGYE